MNKLNRNKKISSLVLGVALVSVGLVGCGGEDYDYDTVEKSVFKSEDDLNDFNKDKLNTVKTLNIESDKLDEFNKLKNKLSDIDKGIIDAEMLSTKEQYYHLVNLNKELNLGDKYEYVFIVDDTDKFKTLYKDLIKGMSETRGNVLVYFPKDDLKNHEVYFNNSSKLTVIYKGDKLEKELNKLDIKHVPTFIALKGNKVKLTLTGYYDYNVIEDKLSVFNK